MATDIPAGKYASEVLRAALPEVLTTRDAALGMALSRNRIRDLIRSGRLPATRIGRRYYLLREDLLAALAPVAPRRSPASPGVEWCSACGDRPAGAGGLCAPCGRGAEGRS